MEIHKRINTGNRYEYEVIEINSIDGFISYFNKIKHSDDFISLPKDAYNYVKDNLNNKVSFKSFIKKVSKLINSPKFKNKIEYWTCRGYSIKDAELKVKKLQTNAANAFAKKRKEYPNKYSGIIPNQIEYWTKRGYSKDDAKLMVSERQRTFSKEICIQKYGKEEGLKIFYERNKKWQESRIKSEGKDWHYSSQSPSIEMYEKRYGNEWILVKNKHLEKRGSSTDKLELNKIIYELNYDKSAILEYIFKCSIDDLFLHCNNSSLLYVLELSHLELKTMWMEHNNIESAKSVYGNLYWRHGKFYKSDIEFMIGEYLTSIGLDFSVNVKYPKLNMFCDFYIDSLNLYIEYMGMDRNLYDDKIKQLKKMPYNIIWSNDYNTIKNTIYEKIYKYNRRK